MRTPSGVSCSHRKRFVLRTEKPADEFGHEAQTDEVVTDGDDVYLEVLVSARKGYAVQNRTNGTRRNGKLAFIPDGRERLVRMCLDSPHFAERQV